MATANITYREDLEDVRVSHLEDGVIEVSARCPLCRSVLGVRLSPDQAKNRTEVSAACSSGRDGSVPFQLVACRSTQSGDGVDVWGLVHSVEESAYSAGEW